jgi:hypothetical protein
MFAADRPLPWMVRSRRAQSEGVVTFDDSVVRPLAAEAEALRDDFAPVDQLRSLG